MNPGRIFIPNMYSGINPMFTANIPARNIGLFSKITNSLKAFNWGGFLNGTNKTLNVVNQAIPLIRQAGPMVNNMKSMMRIAKIFGNETTSRVNNSNIKNSKYDPNKHVITIANESKDCLSNNYPNFFI